MYSKLEAFPLSPPSLTQIPMAEQNKWECCRIHFQDSMHVKWGESSNSACLSAPEQQCKAAYFQHTPVQALSPGKRHQREGRGEHLITQCEGKRTKCKEDKLRENRIYRVNRWESSLSIFKEMSHSFFKDVARTQLWGWTIVEANLEFVPYDFFD